MGRFNTYKSDLKYTPQSFEKTAMLPMEMRKRHDKILDESDLIKANRAHTSVSAPFELEADRLNQEFLTKSADLAARMAKEGASDPSKLQEMRTLKNEYNTQIAANGTLGRGVADKEAIDKRKLEYYSNAMKNNQDGKYIKDNWETELSNRNKAASTMLKESPNSTITPFNPADAPKSIDLVEVSRELKSIMGETKSSVFEKGVHTGKDGLLELTEEGLLYSRKNDDNYKQIKKYLDYLNHNVLDPNSPISLDQRYKANGNEEKYKEIKNNFFLKAADLAGLMTNESEDRVDSYDQENPSTADGRGPTAPPIGAPMSLSKTTETGTAPLFTLGGDDKVWSKKHNLSPLNAASYVVGMDMEEKKPGSQMSKDRAWGPMKQSAIRMSHIVSDFESTHKNEIKKGFDEGIESVFNEYSLKGVKLPKNFQEAREVLDKIQRDSQKELDNPKNGKIIWGSDGKHPLAESTFLQAKRARANLDELQNSTNKLNGLDNNLMYTTDGYTIGISEDADKLNASIDKYVDRVGLGTLQRTMRSSGGYAKDSDGAIVDIDEAFLTTKGLKFNTINTMNEKGYPSISFTTIPKSDTDKIRTIVVDFKEEGKETFSEIVKAIQTLNLEPVSKKRIETMANNIASTSIIPDIETENGKFRDREVYSKAQSDAIMKDHLSKRNASDEFHAIGTKQSITLNRAGYFTAKAASKNSEDFKPFTIENQVKRELQGLKPGSSNYTHEVAKQVATIHELMGYNEGYREDSLDKGSFSLELSPTKRIIFTDAATAMHNIIYAKPTPPQAEQDRALMIFYDKVKGFGLTSKDRVYAQ